MKKILVTVVLGLAVAAAGQDAMQQPAQPAAPGQQKKEIKDPAEYNAYVGAVQQQDPAAKISGLEAFLTQYPNSVMKEDALEALMQAYQQTNNAAKMGDTAQRLLQVNPNNVRALAILTFVKTASQAWPDAKQYGQKGLAALPNFTKPDNMKQEEYDSLKKQLSGIFNRGVGLSSLQEKDYATAATSLRAAVESAPNDVSLVYTLSQAYLHLQQPDYVNGLWFTARAANLAPTPQGQQQIEKYGASQYRKFHGSDQGWSDLMAQTKTTPLPPQGFTITQYVPPTPAEQAALGHRERKKSKK